METEKHNIAVQEAEISLKELILKLKDLCTYVLSKWLIILAAGILGGVGGFVYAELEKPIYTAECTFVLEEAGGGGLGQYAGLASMVGLDLGAGGGGIFQGDNIMELYKSRSMIENTLLSEIEYDGKRQLLIDFYLDFNGIRKKWAGNPELADIRFNTEKAFTRAQNSVLASVVGDIKSNYLNVGKPDKKLSIIKVAVSSENEIFAKAFNDQIVKNVNDFYIQTKTKKSLENVSILQQKTDSVRRVMNGAIYTAAAVADATPNLNPTRQTQRIAPMQSAQYSAQTNKEILGELVKNLEMSKMALRQETPLIQLIDQPVYPLNVDSLSKAKGIIIGAVLLSGLIVMILLAIKLLREVMK